MWLWAGLAAADPLFEVGEPLPPDQTPLGCRGSRCLWALEERMGSCIADCCSQHGIALADSGGEVLSGAYLYLEFHPGKPSPGPRDVARQLSGHSVELFTTRTLGEVRNPDSRGWDPGVDARLTRCATLDLSAEQEGDPTAWCHPERAAELQARLDRMKTPAMPHPPANEALLAEAPGQCAEAGMSVASSSCSEPGSCTVLLEIPGEERCGARRCLVAQQDGALVSRSVGQPLEEHEAMACFEDACGGIKGSGGDIECLSRAQPGRMAFLDTAGLHLEGGFRYPVRGDWQVAPTVHADGYSHVSYGGERWKGPSDASLAWQAVRVGDALHFRVTVADDQLVLLGSPGEALRSDHVELDFRGPMRSQLKLAVLLAPGGKVQVRAWQRAGLEVDEEVAGSGSWAQVEGGYQLALALPSETLRYLEAPLRLRLDLLVSDGDGTRQETLIGTQGDLRLWQSWPPTWQEYDAMEAELDRLHR